MLGVTGASQPSLTAGTPLSKEIYLTKDTPLLRTAHIWGQVDGRVWVPPLALVWGSSEGPSQLHAITGLAEATAGSESVVQLPPAAILPPSALRVPFLRAPALHKPSARKSESVS